MIKDKEIVECDIGVSDELLDQMIQCKEYGFAAHMAFKELRYYRDMNRQKVRMHNARNEKSDVPILRTTY